MNLVWRWSWRIRDIHRFLTSLKVSSVLGAVQLAELKFAAQSVMRGPGETGVLARSDLQLEKLWLKIEG